MKKRFRYALLAVIGGAYGALNVLQSGIFIKNLGALAGRIMKIMKLDGEIVSQVTDALSQLKDARLLSPYPAFILIFACLGVLTLRRFKKNRRIVINVGALLLFTVLITLAAALFTFVNDILFLDMVKLLVSIVRNL